MIRAVDVYQGSDGKVTTEYYTELNRRLPLGPIAVCLFRAQKCSTRAKVYRGGIRGQGSYKAMAYERKQWSMNLLGEYLEREAAGLAIAWGWKEDPATVFGEQSSWVLYIDLPHQLGQVSFHSPVRGKGPDYPGDWDKQHASAERILAFCDLVHSGWMDPGLAAAAFDNA